MKTNKQLWAERHAAGETKADVATAVAVKAGEGIVRENARRQDKKKRASRGKKQQAAALGDTKTAVATETTETE